MTDTTQLNNEPDTNEIPRRIIDPNEADILVSSMNGARLGETDAEKAARADAIGGVYFDLLKRAKAPADPNRPDEDSRAEAAYFTEAMTGCKDAYGTLWRKGGFKTGAEYLAHMKEFFLKSPDENKTKELRDFEAMDEKTQEDAAVAAKRWTLSGLGQEIGNAFGYAMDLVRPNTKHQASKTEVAAANYDMRDAAYRRSVRADHYANLLADNAWIEVSQILPRLSNDGRACAEALMKSPDNALPETMYARFNNLPDNEKQLIVRTRTVLKPRVDGSFLNTLGDMGIGAMNVGASVLAAPYRFGNKLFESGMFFNGLELPGGYTVDADLFDTNEIARRRNYLWEATGRFTAGGEEYHLPQMQFEQICENHGIVADALIGATSTLPYMAAAAVPGMGVATVAMEAMHEMDDHVVMQGGDISDPDYVLSSAIFGALYAYTERLQVEKLLGGMNDMKLREGMLKGVFAGIASRPAVRNLTVGTLSESLQEGLQNGIMAANESFNLDKDATTEFASGFVQDFIGSLGTMFVVEASGLVKGHWARSGYNNPFTAAGRSAGQEARSTDLEAEYSKLMCEDRMVEYAARSQEAKMMAGAGEAARLVGIWENGGKDALIQAGVDPVRAEEFDYFYKSAKEEISVDEETGEAAPNVRLDKAQISINEYIRDKAAEAVKSGEAKDIAAFDSAMRNMEWVRDVWSAGAGIYRKNEDGSVTDPGAAALKKAGFSEDVASRLSRYFHYERAAAYSPAALAGIKTRYEARMAEKVTAKAAVAQQFGGTLTRIDGTDYISFRNGDAVNLVRIDETEGETDFANTTEGTAVSVELATKGKVTAKKWLSMSADERRAMWEKYDLVDEGGFLKTPSVKVTLSADPSVGIDSDQAATILGRIQINSQTDNMLISDTSAAFHEIFHAFANFAQTSNLWTKEDIDYLKKTCGEARHSQETFDEEKGAEAFRSFMARRAAGALTADDEHSPYMRIYAAATGIDNVAKEKKLMSRISNESETAFFHQLIAEANRPKPKTPEKQTLSKSEAPQRGIAPKKEEANEAPAEKKEEAPAGESVKVETPAKASDAPLTWSAYTPTGNVKVSGHWAALELKDVIHSNNPLYAIHMRAQLRNRKDNKAEEDTRKDIVNNFQGERLLDAPDTANGAPIVFYDRDEQGIVRPFVLSGNGRVLVLNELAERHLYDRYRNVMKQWAADRGIVVPTGETPILVRVIDDFGGETRDKIADLSNTNSIQQYTEEEQARADAEVIKSLGLARLYKANADGSPDMTQGANDEFFSEFIRGVGDTSLYNSDRSLTQTARDRAQRALLAIAVGQGDRGRDVVKKLVEQTETLNIQKQKNAAAMMAAPVAALETNAPYSIGPDVSRAMADYMDFAEKRKAGKAGTFGEYLGQMDLLDAPSAVAKEILALLGSDRNAAEIAEYVKAYCKAATMEDPSGGLFGSARTREEIWEDAKGLVDETIKKGPLPEPVTPVVKKVEAKSEPVVKAAPPILSVEQGGENDVPAEAPRGTETFVLETRKRGTIKRTIPAGSYSGLRSVYDPYVSTPESKDPVRSIFSGKVTKQNDPQGRYWGDKMPQFMGHKTEMFDRTVLTLRQKLSPEELAKFDTLVDYFGGGGSWGTSLALTTMPNVKRIVINEFDPGRAKKIELLQTLGESIVDKAEKLLKPYFKEICEDMKHKGDDGGESGSGATFANLLLRKYKGRFAEDIEKLGVMYAITDCASRQLKGSRDVVDQETGEKVKEKITFIERWEKVKEQLANDAKNATDMRKAFEERGGKVEYVNGDSTKEGFGAGFKTPYGANVMAVCDPPYYRTEGYSDDGSSWKVGLESTGLGYAYADTQKLIKKLVDKGDGLVYTDEAWWLKPEYLDEHSVHTDGLFDDSAIQAANPVFRRENEILQGIRDSLDHFDVAGKVAERYETLGIHHGGLKNGNDARTKGSKGNDVIVLGTERSEPDEHGSETDGRETVQRVAGGAEGEDKPVLRSGGEGGQRSDVRTEDVVRDVCASIEDAAIDAEVGAVNKASVERLTRKSVRKVREDKQLAYANLVSDNAAAYLKKASKELDRHMAANGYTEKVWHGTNGPDLNVFRFSKASHGVQAAYFTYRRETAQNYAVMADADAVIFDNDTEMANTRTFYVNPGKVFEYDERKTPTNFAGFKKMLQKAYADGYDSVRCLNTLDDQGWRLDDNDENAYSIDLGSQPGNGDGDFETDILIVFDRPGNPGANRIKAADPVTFYEDTNGELPIPIEMRADNNNPDVRMSVRSSWRNDFPKAIAHTTRKSMMEKYSDLFYKAKAGDMEAAEELIEKVVKTDKIRAIVAEHPNASIVVPVYAEEATGHNQIPRKFADYISALTGIESNTDIVQVVRAFHSGSKADHRLFTQPEFLGPVKRNAEYIIVDDHITQGGTVNALRDHIESNGGKVVAVSALTLSNGSSILSPRKDTIDETRSKWPDIDELLRNAEVAERVEALTESQLRYINKFSPDGFRNRISQEIEQRIARTQHETLGTPSEGVAREETESERESMRKSVFVGAKSAKRIDNQQTLDDAIEMLRKKFNYEYSDIARDLIYHKTGWWRGIDGLWRFEIRDVRTKKRGETTKYPNSDEYVMLNGLHRYADTDTQFCDLTDMVTHTKLFKAYPMLKNIFVDIVNPDEVDFSGSYDPNRNRITLTWDAVVWFDDEPSNVLNLEGLKTLTHEIQHAVQYIEGFAKGGASETHGKRNYGRLAGEVESRNASRRIGGFYWDLTNKKDKGKDLRYFAVMNKMTPWDTEDVPQEKQIISDEYGSMTDMNGNKVYRQSIRRNDIEEYARMAISSFAREEGNKAANEALENYVAYFKLSHGSIPRAKTLARIGLSLGMNVVDPKRILKNGDRIAEKMRGTLIEQASQNGDVGTAMALMKRDKDNAKKLNQLIAGSVEAGGKLTHKGVGQVNALLQRRVETMMRGFSAASLADMEGDTGLDLAAEILQNNPDAFETEYRRAKGAAKKDEEDLEGIEEGIPFESASGARADAELSDADKYKREQLLKEQAARVAKFIEDAKKRADDNEQKAKDQRERRRTVELTGDGETNAEPRETAPASWNMEVAPAKAGFKTPEEFAAFLRVWSADRFAKTHGLTMLGQAQQDKLFAEFYRICARQELQDLADKLLAPQMVNENGETVTNQRLAKIGNGARVWVNRRIADMEKGIRPDTLERMTADIFAFINKAAVRVSRVDLITTFKAELKEKFLEGADFEELKNDTERKLTGWVEEATRYICHVCDLSRKSVNGDPSQLEQEYRKLHEILDARAKVYDDSGAEVGDAAKEDAETRRAQWKLALLDKYGAMRSLMPGEILDLRNAAFDYLENEAKKLEDAWKETREQQDIIRRDFAGAIVGPGDQRYDAGKGIFGWVDKTLLDSLNGMLRLRLEHLTRFAPEAAREKAKEAVNSIIVMLGDGETAYAKSLQADREAFFEGLGQIFRKTNGKADNRAIAKYLERMDEPIPADLSAKISNQGFAGTMTYGQMLQLLVSLEQRSFDETVRTNGREGQAELIRTFRFRNEDGVVENAFTKEDDAFVNFLRSFYAGKRDQLSEVTMRMVGQQVDSPDPLYCPIRRWIDDKARDLHTDPTQRWDPISKIFSRRVPSVRDFDESRTITGLFFENSKESAKLTAWAERGSFIRNVVTSVPFQASVKRAFGPGELSKILKQLEATFNGGEQRSQTPGEVAAADKAVNFITYAYLGFNPLSAGKQTTSFTVWANQLPNGFKDLWHHMTHVDFKVIKHLKESDEYKIRYGNKVGSGMDYATKGLNMNPSENPIKRAISGAGMWMLQRGDFMPGAWIAQGVYKDLLNKHLSEGMNNAAADKLAITETFNMLEEGQQSARTYNTNMLQIEHGRIGRLLTQFATSPLQQLQYETQAFREWRDMRRYNMGKERIAEARAKFRRAVIINHVLIPAAMNMVIAAYKTALGEEPPWEKDGYHWTLLIDLLMGQFSRVFFLGAFAQTTLEALLKRQSPRAGQLLPIEGAIGMGTSAAFLLHDLVTMDEEKIKNDLERAIKSTAPTRIPYNVYRRFAGDSDVDRNKTKRSRRR